MLLDFANVTAATSNSRGVGERQYDWAGKLTFSMKAGELGQLFTHDFPSAPELRLMHDASKISGKAPAPVS